MKKMLFLFLCLVLINNDVCATEKCKEDNDKFGYYYNYTLECSMRTDHFVLWNTSEQETDISRTIEGTSKTIEGQEVQEERCWVLTGQWTLEVENNEMMTLRYPFLEGKERIVVSHIIPFDYLKKKIKCEDRFKIYNNLNNLEVREINYAKKNNKICPNLQICSQQLSTCMTLQENFNYPDLCKEIDKKFHQYLNRV